MFIWDGTLRNVCSRQDSNWIHHSIRVFEGDFTNPGDLDKIVDTCLGLWATAYYTHRLIVGEGIITPQTEHRSSFKRSASYSSYIFEALRPSKGDRHSKAESDHNCAKIHPVSLPQLKADDFVASTSSTSNAILSQVPEVTSNVCDLDSTSDACEQVEDFKMTMESVSTENVLPDQRERHIRAEILRRKSAGACLWGSTAAAAPTPPTSPPSELQPTFSPSSVVRMPSLDERMMRLEAQEPAACAVVELRSAGELSGDASDVSRDSTRESITTPASGFHDLSSSCSSKRSDFNVSNLSPARSRCSGLPNTSSGADDNGGSVIKTLFGRCSKFSTTTLGLVSKVSWRTDDSNRNTERRTSSHAQEVRMALAEIRQQRQSNRNVHDDSSRERVEPKRRKITKEVLATELALQSSNTIYDIVSTQKKEVFPAKYFENLVELLEACIDDSKIVPILRSQRNAKLIESSLKRAPSSMKKTKRRLTRISTAGRALRETQWPVLSASRTAV